METKRSELLHTGLWLVVLALVMLALFFGGA
jgi:hypothetical protein